MIELTDIVRYSTALCADVVRGANTLIGGEKDVAEFTDDEKEASVLLVLSTAALLEGMTIVALPPDKAANVRAFTERLASDIQKARNS